MTTLKSRYVVAAVLEVAEAACSAGTGAAGQVLVAEAEVLWPGLDLRQTPHQLTSYHLTEMLARHRRGGKFKMQLHVYD